MSNLTNSFRYSVKLLGLLPDDFDFSKEENIGVKFQTDKLRKIKKPSEDHHEGEMVSAALLLQNSALVEAKIIRHNNPTNISQEVGDEKDEETPTPDAKAEIDGEGQDVIASASELDQKLKIEDSRDNDKRKHEDGDKQTNDKQMNEEDQKSWEDDENSESESDSDDSTETSTVDKTTKAEHSARFLYRSYYNVNGQQPDFLTYRLQLIFLAIKTDPYFFKVNKIRFKPYGCDNEMEFIQMHWPIQLEELCGNSKYAASNHRGWSGPMFNKWATTDESQQEQTSPCVESTSSGEKTSHVDNKNGDGNNDDEIDSCSTYHRAYIQAELKPISDRRHGSFYSTRGFNILISAVVGGIWDLEEDPNNYTCKHLAEMKTVKEEILREPRELKYSSCSKGNAFFYKRVRMLNNYWQSYLAGEKNYLVGVNGPILCGQDPKEEDTKNRRQINELRLYDVSKIPAFIKKCGAEQGFRPWSKEILKNRLYKSLQVIYDLVKDAPIDTEFMFVKYNEFDPPIHDVDGSITGPYMLAFRQLIIKGLPTPPQPNLVTYLMRFMSYAELVKHFLDRKFKRDDVPKKEEKGDSIILTFQSEILQELFLHRADDMLKTMKEKNKFPPDCGMENLTIRKVVMKKPVAPRGNNSQSWRSSNNQKTALNNSRMQTTPIADSTQSWRNFNNRQPQPSSRNYENNWRRRDSAGDNFPSWRSSHHQTQQQQANLLNNNWRQYGASASRELPRSFDDNRRQRYGGRKDDEQNWRRK